MERGKTINEKEVTDMDEQEMNVKHQRNSDRIAGGVIGALTGALLTLLIMVPIVFSMEGSDYVPLPTESQLPSQAPVQEPTQAPTQAPAQGPGQADGSPLIKDQITAIDVVNVDKINLILQCLDFYYLYGMDEQAMEDGILSGLISGLGDDYAYYYTKDEYAEYMEATESTYYGIGVIVSQNLKTMNISVSHVFRNSPAMESGMKIGDILVEVAGVNILQMPADDVVERIKGEEGSTISIKVYRPSIENYVTMDVERRQVEQDMVYWDMLDDKIGYIQILQFFGNAAGQTEQALEELKSQGMEALVLDLRANPGGLVSSVIDVGELLLPKGDILTVKSNYAQDIVHSVKGSEFNLPLVVLINEYSASASEVLTGAIQDYGVGTIVGVTSYGKGVVQKIFEMSDGSAVKFTIADYYTPAGRNIDGIGIEPDVYVELDMESEVDNQLEKAIEVLKELME